MSGPCMSSLTTKYQGQSFTFYSPFEHTPGWKAGDKGKIVRLLDSRTDPEVDPEIRDLWVGVNANGEEHQLWGGEAWTDAGKPLIPEHRFIGWKPGGNE